MNPLPIKRSDDFRRGDLRILKKVSKTPPAESFFPCDLHNFPIGFILIDPKSNIISLNEQATEIIQRIWGLRLNEGESFLDVIPPVYKRSYKKNLKKAINGEIIREVATFETEIGSFIIDISIHPVNEKNGINSICLGLEDVTERVIADQKLHQLSHLVEKNPASIMITNKEGTITYVNEKFRQVTGYNNSDVLGKSPGVFKSGQNPDKIYKSLWKNISAGKEWKGELCNRKKNGELYWESVFITPITDQEGNIVNFLSVKEDITEKKKSESKAQKSQQLFQKLVENISGVFWITNITENKTIYVSPSYEMIVGRKAEELYSDQSEFLKYVHPEDRSHLINSYKDRGARMNFQYRIVKPCGEIRWISAKSSITMENDIPIEYGYAEDITEKKRYEEEIKASHERYELAHHATQDIIWEWDMLTNVITRSKSDNIYGHEYNARHREFDWWMENVDNEDRDKVLDVISNCINERKEKWECEYKFHSPDGTFRIVLERAYVLYNENKVPYRMVGAMTDVTEKRKLEQELTALQVQKQKDINEIIITAQEKERNYLGKELHDNINQILATVKMYLGLVGQNFFDSEDLVSKSLEYTVLAMDEIRKLAHSLVDPSIGNISLQQAIENLVERMKVDRSMKFNFSMELEEGIIFSKKADLMIYRILQEQVCNILKYSHASEVCIQLYNKKSIVYLKIADNGCGFDPSLRENGIGLSNIKNRVESFTGEMNIVSSPGEGCSLDISFPLDAIKM